MAYRTVGKGDRVSEYILIEKIGVGGFGEVWKAEHAQIPGKFVAIKIPTSPDAMDLLKKEAVFQHQLDHPNIVRTIGLDTQHDPPYFIMEFVEGKNLRQRMLEDGILPPPYAIDIAVQVLEGLAYAHSKNIIHKDIKPENILVEKRKISVPDRGKALLHYVKITDLGLGMLPGRSDGSIVVSEFARTSGMRLLSGTLFYMAPEQMVPGRSVDSRADIYSMGVVLYEMLTGELPLGMDLPSELNPVVTPELDAICKKALSIDRDIRYQTVQEMAADLLRAKESFLLRLVQSGTPSVELGKGAESKGLTPRGVSLPVPPPKRPRAPRRRFVEWVSLVAVVVLLGLSAWGFARLYGKSRQKPSPDAGVVAAPASLAGPLRITSEPSGVEVSINGRPAGTTPFELHAPRHVRTEVRLSHPFYHDRVLVLEPRRSGNRRMFSVVDARTGREQALLDATQGLTLERVPLDPRKGGLKIRTPDVEGVAVRVDGGLLGTTPFDAEINANYYTVRLEKEGYEPFEGRILVDPNSTCTLVVPLVAAGTKRTAATTNVARVAIDSDPPGAAIIVGQEERGITPATLELPLGEYDLRLAKKYFEPHQQRMLLSAPSCAYSVTLRRVRAQVAIESDPKGAAVVLDGKKAGTTPLTIEGLEGGAHEAVLQIEGYREAKLSIEIVDSALVGPVQVTLEKIPPGLLTIDSAIAGVEVYIDNAASGKAPLKSRVLSPGKHRIRVLGVERLVQIDPGADLTMRFTAYDLGMVHVAAGEFTYGTRDPLPGQIYARKETLAAYYVDRHEVTNALYAVFLAYVRETKDHSKCHPDEGKGKDHAPAFWEDAALNLPNHPVVGVDFWDAYAYASWSGKRLPTEKEWEKAARGKSGYTYPWGDQWDPARLNWGDFSKQNYEFTSPVGAFPSGASPYGCLDMAGNAAEWCADSYESNRPDKVVRGGSFRDREWTISVSRWKEAMNTRVKWLGFRCVMDEPK
ncbi:MAG: PEGA domain-containing protein [Planctomycetes bacterium]|nr:PEGA domain-containing protein [Planctomycetota bacterium]